MLNRRINAVCWTFNTTQFKERIQNLDHNLRDGHRRYKGLNFFLGKTSHVKFLAMYLDHNNRSWPLAPADPLHLHWFWILPQQMQRNRFSRHMLSARQTVGITISKFLLLPKSLTTSTTATLLHHRQLWKRASLPTQCKSLHNQIEQAKKGHEEIRTKQAEEEDEENQRKRAKFWNLTRGSQKNWTSLSGTGKLSCLKLPKIRKGSSAFTTRERTKGRTVYFHE